MIVTIRRLARAERLRVLVLSLAMVAWFALIMAVTREAAKDVQTKTQMFDSAMTRGFGLSSLATPDALIAQMAGISFNHPIVLAIIGAVTVALGARSCQGELERGTLEWTLSRSISRSAYLLGYVVVMIASLTIVMVVAWASMVGFDRLLDVPGTIDASRAALLCVNAGICFFGIGALTMLVSVLLGRRGSAMFIAVGILVVMFAITFAERAWDAELLDLLAPLSLFHWYDPGPTLMGVSVPTSDLVWPAVISVACILVALWRFERRDL